MLRIDLFFVISCCLLGFKEDWNGLFGFDLIWGISGLVVGGFWRYGV